MAKLSTAELLDAFKELTLIELSEFVKEFETTFGVTAAAPVAAAAPAGAGGGAAVEEEEAFGLGSGMVLASDSAAVVKAARASEFRQRVEAEGLSVATNTPREMTAFERAEEARWRQVIQQGRISTE